MNENTRIHLQVEISQLDDVINKEENSFIEEALRELQSEMIELVEKYGKK